SREGEARLPDKVSQFISSESPDIVSFQDYLKVDEFELEEYPYSFEKFKTKSSKIGIAIFSKHRIINKGTIDFPNTHNNAIYADVIVH
ncbi:endonuclease, partial [Aquimarina celericrescens]|nr:endonuclease [Aquimarina celericrescens]